LEDGIPVLRKATDDYIDKNEGTSEPERLKFMAKQGMKMCDVDLEAFKKATSPLINEVRKSVGDATVDKVLKAVGY
jgi:TRAP-type C4-dicarboxylate transport system substrate-binding protein